MCAYLDTPKRNCFFEVSLIKKQLSNDEFDLQNYDNALLVVNSCSGVER